jgi:transposase
MTRSIELSKEKRAQMMILHQQNYSHSKIAGILHISKSAVTKGIARAKQLGTLESRKRSGRPRITSATTDRVIHRLAAANPTWSSLQIAVNSSLPASTRTIRRRLLKEFKLPSCRPAKKAMLSKKNIRDRLTFCRKYKDWTAQDWKKTMFSDESTFSQFASYIRHVRRPAKQRYNIRYVVPTVKQAPTVMVWASFSASGRGGIWFMPKNTTINAQVYLGILKEKLNTHMNILKCKVFQHDGAPCHRAAVVTNWLRQKHIEVLGPWPGSSPDLNPIENMWTMIKQKVAATNPTSEKSLIDAIKRVWTTAITPEYCAKLSDSMPARIAAVLGAKGHYSKY